MGFVYEVEIPMLPPSDNRKLKVSRWGGIYESEESKKFKRIVDQVIMQTKKPRELGVIQDRFRSIKMHEDVKQKAKIERINLAIEVIYFGKFLTKAGHWRVRDTANFNKVLFDAVMPTLRLDDSLIQYTSQRKVHADVDRTFVRIFEMDGSDC